MKTIGILGYGSTGASVITDYLSEFSNVTTLKYEFNFLEQNDGILDLEYFLCHQCNRNKTSAVITRFIKNLKSYRNRMFLEANKKEYIKLSKQYIQDLKIISWKGYCSLTPKDCRAFWDKDCTYIFARIFNKFMRLFKINYFLPFTNKKYFGFVKEEDFVKITRKYLNDLINLCAEPKEYLVMEQLFSSTDPIDGFKYFESPKSILVKRDIRDMYIVTNYGHSAYCRFMPFTKDKENFKKYYHDLIDFSKNTDNKDVKTVFFEDLVLHYDEKMKEINEFIGIDETNHVNKLNKFNPEVSKKGIGLYKQHPELNEFFKELKKEFPELIYE